MRRTIRCQDRTCVFPSGKMIQEVMKNCIADCAVRLRIDPKLAQAIAD